MIQVVYIISVVYIFGVVVCYFMLHKEVEEIFKPKRTLVLSWKVFKLTWKFYLASWYGVAIIILKRYLKKNGNSEANI